MSLVRLSILLLGLSLLAPYASAAEAEGRLEASAAHVTGDAGLQAVSLDMKSVSPDTPILTLDAQSIQIVRVGERTARVAGPVPGISASNTAIDERASHGVSRLTLVPGAGDQLVAMHLDGTALGTVAAPTLRPVSAVDFARVDPVRGENNKCTTQMCLDAYGVYEIAAAAADLQVEGQLKMLVYGPALQVVANGETLTYASGQTTSQETGPVAQNDDAWVWLIADGVRGTIATGPAARWYSPLPNVEATAVSFESAKGALRVGLSEYRAQTDTVHAQGDMLLALGAVAADWQGGLADEPIYAESFTAQVSGEIRTINLQATPVFVDKGPEAVGFFAVLATAGAATAYYWPRLAFAAAALYTRLRKPEILDNDVRNHIYDIIRQHPGISAREVHRQSDQSWGTVVYHLRQLERHHLVVSREIGRTRNYYENHGKYRGMEAQLACLQSDRARVLARAILSAPGITQEALATASALPQPTTSYYVRKLKEAGLVEEQREGRYARYVPHAELGRFLQLSETAPQVGANTASGVQA